MQTIQYNPLQKHTLDPQHVESIFSSLKWGDAFQVIFVVKKSQKNTHFRLLLNLDQLSPPALRACASCAHTKSLLRISNLKSFNWGRVPVLFFFFLKMILKWHIFVVDCCCSATQLCPTSFNAYGLPHAKVPSWITALSWRRVLCNSMKLWGHVAHDHPR